jgi:hypothetical protein
VAPRAQQVDLLGDPRVLVRLEERDEVAGHLEIAVDAVARDVGPQAGEVLVPEAFQKRASRRRSAPARS